MGGIQKIYPIPVSIIDAFDDVYNAEINNFTILEGLNYDFLYVIKDMIKFSQEKKESADGTYYETRLEVFTPTDRIELQRLVNTFETTHYIVVYQDNNGYYKVIGTPDEPLNIEADLDSGQIESGLNGYKITFQRKLRSRSPFIEALPEAPLPT